MARTALSAQAVVNAGTTVTPVAANVDGNSIPSSAKAGILMVVNGSGSSINVTTLVPQAGTDGLVYTAPVVAVGAGATKYIRIPFGAPYAQTGDSNATWVNYSAVTTVTVAYITVA
jgi:hypothetical protein